MLLPRHLHRKLNGRYAVPPEFAAQVKESEKPKLYFACLPQSALTNLQKAKVLPKISFGGPMIGVPDEKITTIIDISKFAPKKAAALYEHRTQIKDVDPFLAMKNNPLAKQEYFILRMIGIHEHFMGKHDRVGDRL
jgi:LmbE family N-acetylglucosaminyl deacetylase